MSKLTCFRAVTFRQALWQVPNQSEARFNRIGDPPVQYLSSHPLGPWAELARHLRLPRPQIEEMIDKGLFRHRTWAIVVDDDLFVPVDFASAAAHGISPDELVADDYTACQAWAATLRANGATGVRVPSAALPGTDSIVLFGPFSPVPYLAATCNTTFEAPLSVSAEDATALRTVLAQLRLFGEPHAALDAHHAGAPFVFAEPSYRVP